MAVNISFKLRESQNGISPSKQKETPVIMMVNYGYYELSAKGEKIYKPLKYSTGEKIKPTYWNGERAKQTSEFEYQNFNVRLNNLEGFAKSAIQELLNQNETLSPKSVKSLIDKKNPKIVEVKPKVNNLNEYIDNFIKESENGERLTSSKSKKQYSKSTIKGLKGFQTQLNEYQNLRKKKLDFQHITMDFYDDFILFFSKKNYSPNTMGRHIKALKLFMHYSRDEGLHNNLEIDRKKFKAISEDVENIYLNEKELNEMLNLDLSEKPVLDKVRDVFLIGCFTAQRFEDFSCIKKENIQLSRNGKKVIRLIQKKNPELVIIPIKPELQIILDKYDGNIPKIYDSKLNKHIKTVGEKAGITEMVSIEKTRGGLKVKTTVPKNELIKSHTARRSGCTNMYLAGIPTLDIMKISGHKTEREFLKYIKVSKEETANNLSIHPYFAKPVMKIARS